MYKFVYYYCNNAIINFIKVKIKLIKIKLIKIKLIKIKLIKKSYFNLLTI
jgi:hypothetical protein